MGSSYKSQLSNPAYDGADYTYPPAYANGPQSIPRRCTDLFFYALFLLFSCALCFCAFHGYKYGHPTKLFAPLDSEGNICGFDQGYEEYRYMYVWDIKEAVQDAWSIFDSAVCVRECPKRVTEGVNGTSKEVFDIDCKKTKYFGQKECAEAPLKYSSISFYSYYCFPDARDIPTDVFTNVTQAMSKIVEDSAGRQAADVAASWKVIVLSAFIALLISVIYSFFLKKFAKVLTFVSLVLIFISLVAMGQYFFYLSNPDVTTDFDAYISDKKHFQYVAFGLWGLSCLYLLIFSCQWKSLQIALTVLESASDFVGSNLRLLLVPLIAFVFHLAFLVAWIAGTVMVVSIGEIDNGPPGTQYKVIRWDQGTRYMAYFMGFGGLWVNAMVIACTQFVIIVACTTWYFTHQSDAKGSSSILQGLWWVFRYHLGSFAFGSLIVAIVWAIRIIFEVIAGKTRGSPGGSNPVTTCLICCLRCCISCLDRVIRYINRNAYIQIALTSESFCPSALNAFMLILKNASKFAFLGGIGNVFAFLGKMCIASITTGIAFILIKNWDIVDDHVESPITPLILVFLLAYTIGSIFVSVFTISANAIMQCFLVDLEISGERGALKNRPATLESYTYLAKKQEDGKHANGLN
ncbi:hypothetical protein FGO68_gene10682 [Halteria grandinella]|uniref:Choline transporter-like protein n=1 Tax=Halteria grandinella TaxID=5974 RepID=A0A8J8T4Z0_HALGN|nr:hypothetical protein FGO68_gene10682 [Halteria grandinella]